MVHEYLEGLAGAEVQVVAVLAQVNEDGFHDGLADRRLMHAPSTLESPRCTCCREVAPTRPGARHSKGTVSSLELGMMTIGTL